MRVPSKAAIGSIFVLSGFLPLLVSGHDAAKPLVAAQAEQPSLPSCRYCPNPEYPPEARRQRFQMPRSYLK